VGSETSARAGVGAASRGVHRLLATREEDFCAFSSVANTRLGTGTEAEPPRLSEDARDVCEDLRGVGLADPGVAVEDDSLLAEARFRDARVSSAYEGFRAPPSPPVNDDLATSDFRAEELRRPVFV